jgi:hypothetical protein
MENIEKLFEKEEKRIYEMCLGHGFKFEDTYNRDYVWNDDKKAYAHGQMNLLRSLRMQYSQIKQNNDGERI